MSRMRKNKRNKMSNWTRTEPNEDGWYFWKKRSNSTDPSKWISYYAVTGKWDGILDEKFSLFHLGGSCLQEEPIGGWWKKAEAGNE